MQRLAGWAVAAAVIVVSLLGPCPAAAAAPPGEAAPATAPATAPAAREPTTWHDYLAGQHAFYRASFVDAYQRVGRRGPWDDKAVHFLERSARVAAYGPARMLYQPKDVPTTAELLEAGKALLDAGCTDPLVRFRYGSALQDAGRLVEALQHIRAALPELEQAGYPSFCAWFAAAHVASIDSTEDSVAAVRPALNAHGVKMLTAKLDDYAKRLMVEKLRGVLVREPAAAQVAFVKLLNETPGVDPWLLNVIDGCVENNLAWAARGTGFIGTLTPEGMRAFIEHSKTARERFLVAYKLAPHLPEAAVQMIGVATGIGREVGEDPMEWFYRAEEAQLDNREAYDKIILAMTPRWGGDHLAMYKIGLNAARSRRYDIEGPWQLVRAVDMIAKETDLGWDIVKSPGVYDALCEMADGYAAAHKDDGKDLKYLTFRAALAWRAGKYNEARPFLDRLGDRPDPEAFRVVGCDDMAAAIVFTYAMADPRAREIMAADAAAEASRYEEALATFRKVTAQPDLNRHAKAYVDHRIASVEWWARLDGGEWMDVQPAAGSLGNWSRWKDGGKWHVDPADGGLVAQALGRYQTGADLELGTGLGDRVQLSGTIQLIDVGHPTPGVQFTRRGHEPVRADFMAPGVGLSVGNGPDFEKFPTDVLQRVKGPCDFVWTYDRGAVSLKLGGEDIFAARKLEGLDFDHAYPALTVSHGGIKFTNLKVRKIVDAGAAGAAAAGDVAGAGAKAATRPVYNK